LNTVSWTVAFSSPGDAVDEGEAQPADQGQDDQGGGRRLGQRQDDAPEPLERGGAVGRRRLEVLTGDGDDPGDEDHRGQPDPLPHIHQGQAMRLLDSQLTHQWTLGELAAQLHLSPGYLLRLFRSSTGMPP
jgi:hypothetical protein